VLHSCWLRCVDAVSSYVQEKKVREVGGGWNEIMYMFNKQKLNTRVCGATDAAWSYGELAPNTNCGLEFGKGIMAGNDGIHGYHGLIDDVSTEIIFNNSRVCPYFLLTIISLPNYIVLVTVYLTFCVLLSDIRLPMSAHGFSGQFRLLNADRANIVQLKTVIIPWQH